MMGPKMPTVMVKMADGHLQIVRAQREADGDVVFKIPAGATMVHFNVSGMRVRASVVANEAVTIHAP